MGEGGGETVLTAFIVGAPRSGTSLVQTVLASHPRIASPPETHLMRYLGPPASVWNQEVGTAKQHGVGLPAVLGEEKFFAWLAEPLATVARTALEEKPGAEVFLEKTPDHALHMGLLRRLAENPRFVHLVRDPRAVVSSLLHARDTWGSSWAPSLVETATAHWLRNFRAAMRDAAEDTLLVRYEDLLGRPVLTFSRILDFLGVRRRVGDWRPPADLARSPGELSGALVGGADGAAKPYMDPEFAAPTRRTDIRPLTSFEHRFVVSRCRYEMGLLGYAEASPRSMDLLLEGEVVARRLRRAGRRSFENAAASLRRRRPERLGSV